MFYNSKTFQIVGNLHVNFTILFYSPAKITSLFHPLSIFSYLHLRYSIKLLLFYQSKLSICIFNFFSSHY